MKTIKKTILIFITLLVITSLFAPPRNVRVQINSNPQGATVKVKGLNVPIGATPVVSQFTLGEKYIITFSKPGYKDKTIVYHCDGSPIFANLESEIAFYRVTVNSNVNGADVFVNGSFSGKTPFISSLQGGTYSIRVAASGYTDYNVTINLAADQQIFANLNPLNSRLTINSNINGASVFINGNMVGKTPFSGIFPPAVYNISVRQAGFKDFNTTVNLVTEQSIFANLEPFFGITISLPKGADLYINGEKQNLFWDSDRGRDRDDWKSFYFSSNKENNVVRVKYHGIVIEKNIRFDNRNISLVLDLN